jgi:hypothetical protein
MLKRIDNKHMRSMIKEFEGFRDSFPLLHGGWVKWTPVAGK